MTDVLFSRLDQRLGEFAVRGVNAAADAALLHGWLTHPKSVFWMMQDATVVDVEQAFGDLAGSGQAFLGLNDGRPTFLLERYDPAHSELSGVYSGRPGDVGMHFLVAPTGNPVHGFTRSVIVTVMDFLFSKPETRRVVVEPDVRNHAVHALNAVVGFQVVDTVALRGKSAYLSTCTREQYNVARAGLDR